MVQDWLAAFCDAVTEGELEGPQAAALVAFVRRYATNVAGFVEARRKGGLELVVLDLRTGAPQHPVYPIQRTERAGILFTIEEAQPLVTMLRDDFPDTEHQQLVPEGWPLAICIDDRLWSEARLTWTPGRTHRADYLVVPACCPRRAARCAATGRPHTYGKPAELHRRALDSDFGSG